MGGVARVLILVLVWSTNTKRSDSSIISMAMITANAISGARCVRSAIWR